MNWACALAMMTVLAGCSDSGTAVTPLPAVAAVSVNAPDEPLLVGESKPLSAHLTSADGEILHGRPISWASEDDNIAIVNASGVVTARASGLVGIRATSEGRSGRAEVRVMAPSPVPVVAALWPNSVLAGSGGPLVVHVTGTSFVPLSRVVWNGIERATDYVSASELRITLSAGEIAAASTNLVSVQNPAPGGGVSNAATFRVDEAPAIPPTITALTPAQITVGWSQPFTLSVSGTGFTPASRIWWDGVVRETQFVNATLLRMQVDPADVRIARHVAVEVESASGVRATTVFPVREIAVSRVDLSSPWGSSWTWVNNRLPFIAIPRDGRGDEIPNRRANWRSLNELFAMIVPTGDLSVGVYGLARGEATIEARVGEASIQQTVSVYDAPAFDLVFEAGTGDDRYIGLWSPSVGEAPRRLPVGVVAFNPSPSPTGSHIVFSGRAHGAGPAGNVDLYIAARDGSGVRRLTVDDALELQPTWSPDGQRIAFTGTAGGLRNVWVMTVDGLTSSRLTSSQLNNPTPGSGMGAGAPAWSPNGEHLVYCVTEHATTTLWIMRADGSGKRQLTSAADGNAYEPTWSPDGRTIAFRREWGTPGQRALAFVSAEDGTTMFPAIGTAPMSTTPSYSPDGRWLTASDSPLGDDLTLYAIPLREIGGPRVVLPTTLGGARGARWIRRP